MLNTKLYPQFSASIQNAIAQNVSFIECNEIREQSHTEPDKPTETCLAIKWKGSSESSNPNKDV